MIKPFLIYAFLFFLIACNTKKKTTEKEVSRTVTVPKFNADSAYVYVQNQVRFGPRIPNTKAHRETAMYLIQTLKRFGATVVEQNFDATTFDRQQIKLKNIIASFNPTAKRRVLLAAHWDTRPFADKDKEKKNAPFDGANDGASGVGVLLEVARNIGKQVPTVGVDIIFFDGEDWGEYEDSKMDTPLPDGLESWWCLGSQYWTKHKHVKNYTAYYGLLLDMVGAAHSQFFQEGTSMHYAPSIVEKVWNRAQQMGYSDYFIKQPQAAITDDHVFINKNANIPTIDIVHYQTGIGYFGTYHHTLQDNLSLISKETVQAVGHTVLGVIYWEE